ncbi:cysteine hydrolase family protein [Chitinophaga varians]|uniref:cysteine hydrolase family protein n=1 Tax=Chitinophaga varians TaxID=2202339 RepID=UPI001CB7590D|nr:cysteine hydrolase family protein [Chitinophaga varians]
MNMRHLRVSVLALILLFLTGNIFAKDPNDKTNMKKQALLIIDVQQDYFKGGKMELSGPDAAAANISQILKKCRQEGIPVIYIKHQADAGFLVTHTPGAEIHSSVQPVANEKIITKHYPNSFRETELLKYLQQIGTTDLIITGMMTHACVDATTRAAKDFGFHCTVVADACATRDLKVNQQTVPAAEVQRSLMAALAFFYADIINTQQYLQ